MKNCPNCNAINNDASVFCETCGAALPQQAAPQYRAPQYNAPIFPQFNENMLPPEYEPVSVGAYIGYMILFAIPVVGFIMMLVTAFGSGKKSLKNFARAYLIVQIIAIVIGIISGVALGLLGAGAMGYYYY